MTASSVTSRALCLVLAAVTLAGCSSFGGLTPGQRTTSVVTQGGLDATVIKDSSGKLPDSFPSNTIPTPKLKLLRTTEMTWGASASWVLEFELSGDPELAVREEAGALQGAGFSTPSPSASAAAPTSDSTDPSATDPSAGGYYTMDPYTVDVSAHGSSLMVTATRIIL